MFRNERSDYMKVRNLLNMQVISSKNKKFLGLIHDICIKDHCIKYLILSFGGLFSKAQFIIPSDIVDIDYDHLEIESEKEMHKISAKEMKIQVAETYSIINLPVNDIEGNRFAKVADATISNNLKEVLEYDLSRSFFDDLDYGYSLVSADQLFFKDNVLVYNDEMFAIKKTNREGGILQKILGEDHDESITR